MSIKAISWAFQQRLDDPTAKLVLIGIADKYNEDRGYAWPSVAALAEMADCTERTVSRKLAFLEEAKLIATIRHPTRTNRYFLPHMTSCRDDTGVGSDRTSDVCSDRTSDVSRTIENDSEQKDSIKSASEQFHAAATKQQIKDGFDRFWKAVPRKVGKKGANVAYRAALKTVDAEELIAGMEKYAKKMASERTEPRFICHPTTWLQQGRWEDEEVEVNASVPIGSRDWVPETKEEFMEHVMGNEMRRDWLLQNRPGIFHHAITKGWISERPRQTRTFG